MLKIEVKAMSQSHRPRVLAEAVVSVGDSDSSVTIHDVRVLQNRQGVRWVALPSHPVSKTGTDFSYRPTVEMPEPLVRELTAKVLDAYQKWVAGGCR